jgi:hypothetical protein
MLVRPAIYDRHAEEGRFIAYVYLEAPGSPHI